MPDDDAPETPEAEAPETPEAPEAEVSEAPESSPWDDPAAARSEIEKLRKENADRRVKLRDYEDVFGGVDDNDRDAILGFVKAYKDDPASAGAIAKQWSEALTPAERGEIAEGMGAAQTAAPLTEERFNALMAEREQAQGVQRAVEELHREATALDSAYADADGPDYLLLIKAMNRLGTTDVKQGHAEVEAYKQAIRDGYVNGKRNEAENGKVVPEGGAPAGAKKEIKSLEDANEAARAWAESLK